MTDLIFAFTFVSWDASRRRGGYYAQDRLSHALVTNPQVDRLLVANPYRSAPLKAARRIAGPRELPFPASASRQLIEPLRLRRHDPVSIDGMERTYARYEQALRAQAQELGIERPAIITTSPAFAGFAKLDWARAVTFYATDDWTVFGPRKPWWPAFQEAFRRVAAAGHRVAAVSDELLGRIAPQGPGIVIPSGVEPDEWDQPPVEPAWFAALARPRAVYVGILDERLDPEALRALGSTVGSVSLIGGGVSRSLLEELQRIPNVAVHGKVGRSDVASILRSADVGLVPHRRSPLSEAMSPLKLYEYLAAGLPVVATNLAGTRGVHERVLLVDDAAEFPGAVTEALALGRADDEARANFVVRNSWRRRHGDLLTFATAQDAAQLIEP